MAERRSTRTKRRPDDDELTEDELEEEPDDELAEEPEDELEDELEEEPEDELAEVPDDEFDEEDSGQGRSEGTKRHPRRGRSGGLTAAKAGQAALRQINELIAKTPEGVTGVEPADEGWVVGVEVVEDRRIPSSTDILATYEIEIDSGGDLMSYRRVRRYPRGRGDDEDA
jgi:hypothetical protein